MKADVKKMSWLLLTFIVGLSSHAMKTDWISPLGSSNRFTIKHIMIDEEGNNYSAGIFYDSLFVNTTQGRDTLIDQAFGETFILKQDSCGGLIWAKQFFGTSKTEPDDMLLTARGEIVVVGRFSGSTDFDPSSSNFTVSPQGGNAIYIVKLDKDGTLMDVGRLGGSPGMYSPRVAIDAVDNLYVSFVFSGGAPNADVDLNPSLSQTLLFKPNGIDGAIIKLFPNWDLDWVYQIRGPGFQIYAADVMTNGDEITAAFHFQGAVNFDGTNGVERLQSRNFKYDGLAITLDSSKTYRGHVHYIGTEDVLCRNVSAAPNGDLYLTGYFNDSLSILSNNQSIGLKTRGGFDSYLSRVSKNGDLRWMRKFSAKDNTITQAMEVAEDGNIYISGIFMDSLEIDSNGHSKFLVSPGVNSQYMAVYSPSGDLVDVKQFDIETGLQSRFALDGIQAIYVLTNYAKAHLELYDGDTRLMSNGNEKGMLFKLSNTVNQIQLGKDTTLCLGDSLLLLPRIRPNEAVLWSNGATTNELTVKSAGTYAIEVSNCGKLFRDTIVVNVMNKPSVFVGNDTTVCEDVALSLSPRVNQGTSFFWSTGETSQQIVAKDPGQYILQVFNGRHCMTSDSITIDHVAQPQIFADSQQILCAVDQWVLDAGNAGSSYLWDDGSSSRTLTVNQDGLYKVTVDNSFCVATDSINLTFLAAAECLPQINIPNAFTPNNDGINDFLLLNYNKIEEIDLQVYDRTGKRVYQTQNKDFHWDGRSFGQPLSEGVYFLVLEYSYYNVGEKALQKESYSSTLSLMR